MRRLASAPRSRTRSATAASACSTTWRGWSARSMSRSSCSSSSSCSRSPILFRIDLPRFFRAVREPAIIAFSTSTSEAALPRAMEAMERFGVPRRIVSFVMPLGYTFNLDGTTLYLSLAAVFVAQAAGVELTAWQQVTMLLTLMLTSKGVAGVPRASLVILAGTLASYNLPLAGVTLILGVDALMDMARTMTNVIGNCLATAVVARWEGQLGTADGSRGAQEGGSGHDLTSPATRGTPSRRPGAQVSPCSDQLERRGRVSLIHQNIRWTAARFDSSSSSRTSSRKAISPSAGPDDRIRARGPAPARWRRPSATSVHTSIRRRWRDGGARPLSRSRSTTPSLDGLTHRRPQATLLSGAGSAAWAATHKRRAPQRGDRGRREGHDRATSCPRWPARLFNPLPRQHGFSIGGQQHFGSRLQPNSPGDDEDEILFSILEGLTYGCGDVIIGINPAADDLETIVRLEQLLEQRRRSAASCRPATACCPTSVKQRAAQAHTRVDVGFQSLAGTSKALSAWSVSTSMACSTRVTRFDGLLLRDRTGLGRHQRRRRRRRHGDARSARLRPRSPLAPSSRASVDDRQRRRGLHRAGGVRHAARSSSAPASRTR